MCLAELKKIVGESETCLACGDSVPNWPRRSESKLKPLAFAKLFTLRKCTSGMVLTGVQVVIKIQFSSGGLRQMAMKSSSANRFLAVMMAVLLPVSILCADTRGAMLSVTNAAV